MLDKGLLRILCDKCREDSSQHEKEGDTSEEEPALLVARVMRSCARPEGAPTYNREANHYAIKENSDDAALQPCALSEDFWGASVKIVRHQ